MVNGINSGIGLSGVTAASRVLGNSAHQVANVNTSDFKAGTSSLVDRAPGVRAVVDPGGQTDETNERPSNVSLTRETATQIGAQALYRANLASIRTEDEVLGAAIDIKR